MIVKVILLSNQNKKLYIFQNQNSFHAILKMLH